MTLKELWEERGFTPTQVAGLAHISVDTLRKMNRKEKVYSANIANVCHVLNISRQEYEALEAGTRRNGE